MKQILSQVNSLYRIQDFNNDGKPDNIHLLPGNITIFKDASDKRYNFSNTSYAIADILDAMTYHPERPCLAIALVHRDFGMGWGRVYRAILGSKEVDGICSWIKEPPRRYNVGVITDIVNEVHVPNVFLSLFMAHEIAHGFGARHDDPHDPQCGNQTIGGEFIMAPVLDMRYPQGNMFTFSPCSKKDINALLNSGADRCFEEGVEGSELCGNGDINEGEECDCGSANEDECNEKDKCCAPKGWEGPDYQCTLRRKKGIWCSPARGPCCTRNCELVDRGKECSTGNQEASTECMSKKGMCQGYNAECSVSLIRTRDGTPCSKKEKTCKSGKCNSTVCRDNGFEDCTCPDQGDDRCERCCKSPGKGCLPASKLDVLNIDGSKAFYSNGTGCRTDVVATCDGQGKCIAASTTTITSTVTTSTKISSSTVPLATNSTLSFSETGLPNGSTNSVSSSQPPIDVSPPDASRSSTPLVSKDTSSGTEVANPGESTKNSSRMSNEDTRNGLTSDTTGQNFLLEERSEEELAKEDGIKSSNVTYIVAGVVVIALLGLGVIARYVIWKPSKEDDDIGRETEKGDDIGRGTEKGDDIEMGTETADGMETEEDSNAGSE